MATTDDPGPEDAGPETAGSARRAEKGSAARWDARYAAASGGLFGDAPNAWLRMLLARPGFAPRTALMLADGDGRNGTWLAARGIAVTAVDLSGEATRRALARDAAAGVAAERITADLTGWHPGWDRAWDLVTLFSLQGPATLRHRAVRLAAAHLAPGGWLALEGFARTARRARLGPDDPAARYTVAEVLDWTPGLGVVEALSGQVLLDEGPRHAGLGDVVRILLRRG